MILTKAAVDADEHAHVKAIIAVIARRYGSDKARSPADLYFYTLRAAHKVNIFEPFTDDQRLLNELLTELQAGRQSCEYAWALYAKNPDRNI